MDLEKLYKAKSIMTWQVLRDILIENNLTTHADFKDKLVNKIEASNLSEDDKRTLKEDVR